MGEINIEELAAAYRRLVLWFGAQLLVTPYEIGVRFAFGQSVIAGALGLAGWVAGFVALAALGYYGYRSAGALGWQAPWLWGVAMLVPCANALVLLILSQRATHACEAHGVRVGLLGPRPGRSQGERGGAGGAA